MVAVEESFAPEPPAVSRASILLPILLLVIAAVCQTGLWGPFAWDDRKLVASDVIYAEDSTPFASFTAPFWQKSTGADESGYYRPIVQLSFAMDHWLWGAEPFGYHLTNLLLHLGCCALLFLVVRRAGASPLGAALAVLVFGLAPRLSENVFWVSGRTDLVAGLFVMLALLVYRSAAPAVVARISAGLLLLVGLLAKEVAVAGVVALTALELARVFAPGADRGPARRSPVEPRSLGGALRNLAPIWIALAVYLALRHAAIAGSVEALAQMGWLDRFLLSAESLGRYTAMLFDPLRPALRIGSVRAPRNLALVSVGLAAAVAALWLLRRTWFSSRAPARVASLALAFSSLGLVLHALPVRIDVVAADRFLYLPLLGLCWFLALVSAELRGRRARLLAAAASLLVISSAGSLVLRAEVWRDELTLWLSAKRTADAHDSVPNGWIALLLTERHHPGLAVLHLENALRIETGTPGVPPRRDETLGYLARISTALSDLGRYEDALHAISQVVANAPNDPAHRTTRALLLARLLRFDEAVAEAEIALALPGLPASDRARLGNIGTLRQAWERLPAPQAGEPTSLRIARARIFDQLGAIRRAEQIWHDVLSDPAVTEEQIYQAARFFCFRSRPERAEPVVDRLLALAGVHHEDARVLVDALDEARRAIAREPVPTHLIAEVRALAAL